MKLGFEEQMMLNHRKFVKSQATLVRGVLLCGRSQGSRHMNPGGFSPENDRNDRLFQDVVGSDIYLQTRIHNDTYDYILHV